jgi:hypothetical protein
MAIKFKKLIFTKKNFFSTIDVESRSSRLHLTTQSLRFPRTVTVEEAFSCTPPEIVSAAKEPECTLPEHRVLFKNRNF